jgi:hypothetical protein
MMILAITGTRDGAAYDAHERVRAILASLRPTELFHGDCIGADS